jgi:hypothetical protein
MEAAARASRTNRCLCVRRQVRGQDLDGHHALEGQIDRLEDDTHAALPDDGLYRVMAKPAEFARFQRRLEEIETYRVALGRIHVLARDSGSAAK